MSRPKHSRAKEWLRGLALVAAACLLALWGTRGARDVAEVRSSANRSPQREAPLEPVAAPRRAEERPAPVREEARDAGASAVPVESELVVRGRVIGGEHHAGIAGAETAFLRTGTGAARGEAPRVEVLTGADGAFELALDPSAWELGAPTWGVEGSRCARP